MILCLVFFLFELLPNTNPSPILCLNRREIGSNVVFVTDTTKGYKDVVVGGKKGKVVDRVWFSSKCSFENLCLSSFLSLNKERQVREEVKQLEVWKW